MSFRDPWCFALFIPVALAGLAAWRRRRPGLRFPTIEGLTSPRAGLPWHRLPLVLRLSALGLMAVALARPQEGLEQTRIRTQGVDIVLALDVSASMLAEDFRWHGMRRNRLAVVKEVVKEFVERRPNDRIGLVVFAGRAYTAVPLTLDHAWLQARLDAADIGMVSEDGTAIGSAIATAVNRLRESDAKSRLIILLSDGVNNAGSVTPDVAAELARATGIKLYTVGAGTRGPAPYPAKDAFGRTVYEQVRIDVDDEGLHRIAEKTGGAYFRATDTQSLQQVYAHIDRLETSPFEQPVFLMYRERYGWWLAPALLLILLELVAAQGWCRVLP